MVFVSISALSDRGLLLYMCLAAIPIGFGFNIRSFGSWIASLHVYGDGVDDMTFQYPLFRIVDCFMGAAVDRDTASGGFNIRSFGSWIAS